MLLHFGSYVHCLLTAHSTTTEDQLNKPRGQPYWDNKYILIKETRDEVNPDMTTSQKYFPSRGLWVTCCLLDPLRVAAAAKNKKTIQIEANGKMLPAA